MFLNDSGKIRAFLMIETMIGLIIISMALTTFYFNQSCFIKSENELYLKNLQVQEAFQKSIMHLRQNKKIDAISVHSNQGVYQINVKK